MAMVPLLIGGLIALVVGVSLVPTIVTTVNNLDTGTTPQTVLDLVDLLPIIFVASLIVAAVSLFFARRA